MTKHGHPVVIGGAVASKPPITKGGLDDMLTELNAVRSKSHELQVGNAQLVEDLNGAHRLCAVLTAALEHYQRAARELK
jgi:hypothetical protein